MVDRGAAAPIANPQSAIHNPQSMKILLLTWDYPPARGGIQIWMFELARRLPDARVTVFAPATTGDAAFDAASHVRVRRLRRATSGLVPWLFHLSAATLWACRAARLRALCKGHDTAIRALPLIKAKCPDVRYVIAGDGPLRDYLTRVARSVGVERDVVFVGEVADEDLTDLYLSSDVLVLLSRESASEGGAEGFGIVSLEAAACGKPVVAGRSGGLVDSVSDGGTGILVDPLDTGAAAETIVSVL